MPQNFVFSTARQLHPTVWLGALLILPWINPYAAGPTANAWPWLISALCAVFLGLFWRRLNSGLIAATWVMAAALSAAIAMVQYFGLSEGLSPWISQAQPGEAFSNLRQRNQFASLTSIGFVALIGWLACQPLRRAPGWANAIVFLLALGNAASTSRTGFLQWTLVLGLTVWWAFREKRWLVIFALQAVLAYLLATALLPWALTALTGAFPEGLIGRLVEAPNCSSRKVLWSNVLTLIAQKPWGGWGWGELDYAHFITAYPGPRFCEILDNAHNLPLHLAVELGIPAALALCGGLAWVVWRSKPWQETNPSKQMAWGVLAVILLHSMLEYPLWYGPFQIACGLCGILLWASPGTQPMLSSVSARPQWIRASIAIFLIAIWMGAAVGYYRVSQIYFSPAQRNAAYRTDTLNKIRGTWLFGSQVRFAELSITPLEPANAPAMYALAQSLLHYSPEPRVVEKLIDSAAMLGHREDALLYKARYRAAYPEDYARWVKGYRLP